MPFQPKEMTEATLKGFVDRLHRFSKATPPGQNPKRAWSQEAIARALGFPSFHAAQQAVASDGISRALPKQSWRISCPNGFVAFSEMLFPQPEEHVIVVEKTLLEYHALLLGRERDRAHSLIELIQSNPKQPVLFVRGSASTPASDQHGLPERSFSALQGYSAALDHLFSQGTAGDIGEALIAELDYMGSDNSMWRNRAISLLSSVLQALVWKRNHSQKRLDRSGLADHLQLSNVEQLAFDEELPKVLSGSLKAYLRSLPGYEEGAVLQSTTTIDQHGFLQMQFTRVLRMEGDPLEPLPRMALHLAQEKHSTGSLAVFLEAWARQHRGGLMVFDGLTPTSSLYEWVTTAIGKLEAREHCVVVGARTLADLSDAQNQNRITSRLGVRVVLGGTVDSRSDARRLSLFLRNGNQVLG